MKNSKYSNRVLLNSGRKVSKIISNIKGIMILRYSFPRLQWLLTTFSAISLLYITSDFWTVAEFRLFPKVIPWLFIVYLVFFLGLIMLVNFYDISKLSNHRPKNIFVAFLVTVFDTSAICAVEFLCLVAIGAIMQDYITVASILLLGALPASLGSIVLSSLTARALNERSKKLLDEVTEMRKAREVASRRRNKRTKKAAKNLEETDKLIKELEKT
jgi:hypothetical protein